MNLRKDQSKGNGSGANRGDVEVDGHCLEKGGGTSRKLEISAGEGFLLVEVARLFVGVAAGERMPRIGD